MIELTRGSKRLFHELKHYSAETYFHSIRVKSLTKAVLDHLIKTGKADYTQSEINCILEGALLHDVGKIYVRNYVLTKKACLTDAEKTDIAVHTQKGAEEICKELDGEGREIIRNICLYHHERIDGGGYYGKTDIPLYVQVVATCDAFDALTSDRIYKAAMPPEVAVAMIEEQKCGAFSAVLVDSLKKAVRR